MSLYSNKPPARKPTMTSREVGALIVSEGRTTDADKANLMAQGKLLDPDALERSYYRRILGFDCTVKPDLEDNKWLVTDEDLHVTVRTPMDTDDMVNAQRLSRAIIKLKAKHQKLIAAQKGGVV
jgi:hypothetical protein